MNIYLPGTPRQRLKKALAANRALQEKLAEARSDLAQLRTHHARTRMRADEATDRADALEKANGELRSDLNSWLDKAVSSDG